MMRLKLIALVSAGIMTLAAFAGCTGGEGGNATSPAPTYSPVVTKAPDPRGTMPPAEYRKSTDRTRPDIHAVRHSTHQQGRPTDGRCLGDIGRWHQLLLRHGLPAPSNPPE